MEKENELQGILLAVVALQEVHRSKVIIEVAGHKSGQKLVSILLELVIDVLDPPLVQRIVVYDNALLH